MISKIKIKPLNQPEAVKKSILWVTFIFSLLVYTYDLLNFTSQQIFSIWVNLVSVFIILVLIIFYFTGVLSVKLAYGIGVYSIFGNVIISFLGYSDSGALIFHYYRNSFFLLTLIGLTAYVVHQNHALIMGGIHLIISILLMVITPHRFVSSNVPVITLIFIAFTCITYYFIGGLKDYMNQLNELNTKVNEQNENMGKQNEELKTQAENLKKANAALTRQRNKITKQRDELAKANTTKDKFFSILAHDLKNPIHLIVNFSDLLRRHFHQFDDNKKMMYIDTLKETADNTYKLLENILYWARSQTGRLKVNKTEFDLIGVFHDAKTLYEKAIEEKGIQIHFPGDKECIINADQDMLYTVVRNLISNAIKYTPDNGNIWLEIEQQKGYVSFSVMDDGLGMKKSIKDNLFSTESTVSSDGIKGEKGTGLGLIICQEFVERLDGTIQVESEEGKGSRFTVTIPV